MALAEDRLDLEDTEQIQEPEFGSAMKVKKRNGDFEPVDVNKIVRAVERCSAGLMELIQCAWQHEPYLV